ncbi:uncharacterized protein MELLADRAFT_110616 [Melampsora larici-populina 98AG31]|uniref:Ribonuclease P/MRP protein subunit POP5 n=1 Tax=Melampsora larici-populina (strain 98AG31 / pathotype 3-4-7) TaxID=747676 RepID=F4S0E0_MELLP|nr:uncharacterized protein MELLADRAFT_110616 [Melampsora larici-populina 98AG31]EGG01957.1 hypothetical protein MELLADRAFT_110616 [Melampsora larici-populina 98AG31]
MVRFKNRYVLINLMFNPNLINLQTDELINLNSKEILESIRHSILQHFGELNLGQSTASLNIKYYSPITSLLILRCSRDSISIVRVALMLIRQIKGHDVIFQSINVSGTMRKTQEAAIRFDRELVLQHSTNISSSTLTDPKEIQTRHETILNIEI